MITIVKFNSIRNEDYIVTVLEMKTGLTFPQTGLMIEFVSYILVMFGDGVYFAERYRNYLTHR
jgi:hypothetical protein